MGLTLTQLSECLRCAKCGGSAVRQAVATSRRARQEGREVEILKGILDIGSLMVVGGNDMTERLVIQQDLDQFIAHLIKKGHSVDWVGLELMTLGVAMLSRTVGAQHMAEHCRLMAAQFDQVAGVAERNIRVLPI